MPKIIYHIGKGFQVIGLIFTSISLLLFGKSGSMATPMMTAAIGGIWFYLGFLFVRKGFKQ